MQRTTKYKPPPNSIISIYQFRNIIFALLVNSGVIWLDTTHATHVHVCIYPATRTTPIELSWNVSKTFQAPKFFDKWSKTTLLSKLAAICFALVLDLDLQYWNFTVGRYVKFAIQLVTSYHSPLLRAPVFIPTQLVKISNCRFFGRRHTNGQKWTYLHTYIA